MIGSLIGLAVGAAFVAAVLIGMEAEVDRRNQTGGARWSVRVDLVRVGLTLSLFVAVGAIIDVFVG